MTINQQKLEELYGRLFAEISAGYGGVMVALGDKLGLYKAMVGAGPLSSHEVAAAAPSAMSESGSTRRSPAVISTITQPRQLTS
jgi:hypothetical protein